MFFWEKKTKRNETIKIPVKHIFVFGILFGGIEF